MDCQFSYSKLLSQQRHLPNDPENCTLEPRGIWNCVRLQCTSTSGVSISVPIRFSFVDQSSPRRLENFGEDIPTSPDVIGAHTLNFKPNFKFSRLIFFRGDPRPTSGVRYQGLANLISSACINFRAQNPLGAEIYSSQKIHFGGSILASKTFFSVCGPKFTGLFSWNAGGIGVDHISFRFWISGVIPEIFAIKVESCQKSR